MVPQEPAIYARISLDRTGEALGVQRQIQACREKAAAMGWPEPRVYSDNDISARSGKRRPSFEDLLADIEAGVIDGLIAWHLDRVLRRVVDLERVLDAIESQQVPVPVHFLQAGEVDLTNPSGRLMARILAAVAANESEMKSVRLSAQRAQSAQAGKPHGPLGYGYDENQRIVPDESKVIRDVAARILNGESLYSIAQGLNSRGVPTPGAGRWDARRVVRASVRADRPELVAAIVAARGSEPVTATHMARLLRKAGGSDLCTVTWVREQQWLEHITSDDHGLDDSTIATILGSAAIQADRSYWRAANLRAMIRRGSLSGWREFSPGQRGGHGDLVAQGDWTPILSKETIEAIREVTDRPGQRKRGREPKYLLAAILKCGKCGSSLSGSPDGRGAWRYACSKQPGRPHTCGGLTITGPSTDRLVSLAIIDVLADAKVRSAARRGTDASGVARIAESTIAEISQLRTRYAGLAGEGRLHPDEWDALREGLDRRQREAERALGAWAPNVAAVLTDVPKGRSEIQAWWEMASIRRKREVVKTLVERIEIAPRESAGNRFDPSRLGEPIWRL